MSFDKNIHPSNHHNQNSKHFHYTRAFARALFQSSSHLTQKVNTTLISIAIAQFVSINIGKLFYKGTDSKHFRLCRAHTISVTTASPPPSPLQPSKNVKAILNSRLYKNGHQAGFDQWATVQNPRYMESYSFDLTSFT